MTGTKLRWITVMARFNMYGPDAKKLYELIKKTIEQTSFMKGANIRLRFGPLKPGVKEISFILNLN